MDEVEVIQNYLLSNAGEDTDVILGLGYDNSLGSEIGITLIATGFEHKDPFEKKPAVVTEEKATDKIVMTLEMPEKAVQPTGKLVKIIQQPTLQFDENEEEKAIEEITEKPVLVMLQDEMMPTLVEVKRAEIKVESPRKTTGEKLADAPIFFEISSAADQTPVIAFDIPTTPVPIEKPIRKTTVQPIISATNKDASNAPSSGVKLAKPAQIYVQEQPTPESNSTEELLPLQITIKADEPEIEMQLVVKSHQAAEEEQLVQQTQPIMMSNVEDPAPQDETEELRRRAIERIAKLRNLSFNINAADPNNEFEMVPAYLRRNMELHNSIAEVENFYSNYTVKSDDNNQAEISTINSFLEGKKPD
jgi:cell division protein FtsZ